MKKLESPLVIDNYHELLALHRMLFEARFVDSAKDPDVPLGLLGSKLANQVVDLLEKHDKSWSDWRIADAHQERIEVVKSRIKDDESWSKMGRVQKNEHLLHLFAPLVPSEKLAMELINEIS